MVIFFFVEDFLFLHVLSVLMMCVWCTIWYVNRLSAFLMHWQQEIQYIWMYLNNVSSFALLMHFCQNLADCDAGGGVCGICGLQISEQCRCKYTTKQCSIWKFPPQILYSTCSLFNKQHSIDLELATPHYVCYLSISKLGLTLWSLGFEIDIYFSNTTFITLFSRYNTCQYELKILQCARLRHNIPNICTTHILDAFVSTFWLFVSLVKFHVFNPDRY